MGAVLLRPVRVALHSPTCDYCERRSGFSLILVSDGNA